ncbi:MAG: bac 5 protein [Parachlamydiales bacterium]|nr:bac 5 protein [Parachlamydiales bacterium]
MFLQQHSISSDRFPDELRALCQDALRRFTFFDDSLTKGALRMIVNSTVEFCQTRSISHLRTIILAQFFLQKKMEAALKTDFEQKHIFLRFFRKSSRICTCIAFSNSQGFQREQFLKTINTLLPGIQEEAGSFYLWHHPDLPYFLWYIELHKLRGKEPILKDLRAIEKVLQEQLLAASSLTPALFWPYNKEESFRQIQLLKREMTSKKDMPHVSIHFLEQHRASLEFFIHLIRPKASEPIDQALNRLPDSLCYLRYFHSESKTPFPIEIEGFSINVPSHVFDIQDSINLLYARRYVLKFLETVIGPLRDFNGGLFAQQQQHFEAIRIHLGARIPYFDLFAERLFYALHPVETWLSLSLNEAEELFCAFSELIQEKKTFAIRSRSNSFTIIKTADGTDRRGFSLNNIDTESTSYAQIIIGGFHYLCLLGPDANVAKHLMINPIAENRKTLRLCMQEGAPPSLNPQCSSSDLRCSLLTKLLFDGLTRLDSTGAPELAGADQYSISPDKCTYTFHIRPSYWSNGESVTSLDYAASWQWALREHLSHPERFYLLKNARLVKENRCTVKELGIRAIDTETLQIELERPDPRFLHKLAHPTFFPMFGHLREPKWFNGPYLVREQSKDGLILELNPYFWNKTRSFLNRIDIRYLENSNAIFSLFKKGELDWIGDPLNTLTVEQIENLSQKGHLRKQLVQRRLSVYFNTTHPLLASAKIRRALSLAIDRGVICSSIYPDCEPLEPCNANPAAAAALFQEGIQELGISLDPLTLTFSQHTRRKELAQYLQTAWQECLGIPVQLEALEWNDFRSRFEKRTFEIGVTIQNTVDEDTPEFYERFENASSWNFSQWTHLPYRETIVKGIENKKSDWKKTAQKILADEVPFAPLFNYVHFYAQHSEFDGIRFDEEGCVDFSCIRQRGRAIA